MAVVIVSHVAFLIFVFFSRYISHCRMPSKFGSGALPLAAMLPHGDHGWAASGLPWKLQPREV